MLRLSAASFLFTPVHPLPLAGYVHRRGVYNQVDGNLEAVFLLLSDSFGNTVLVGSVDTLFVTETLSADIRDLLGHTLVPLFLFATHTHNAPSLAPDLPSLGAYDPEWYRQFVLTCASTIRNLIDGRVPHKAVTVRYGKKQTALNISRRRPSWVLDYPALLHKHRLICERRVAMAENKHGFVDPWLRAIFMEDQLGNMRAVIWSLAAHPARYPGWTHVSPDYPGLIRDALRRRFGPDCMVVYLPGLAGSAIPRILCHRPNSWKQACLSLLPLYPTSLPVGRRAYHGWVNRVFAALLEAYESRERPAARDGVVSTAHARVPAIFARTPADGPDIGLLISRLSLARSLDILAFNGEMLGEWMPLLGSAVRGNVLFSGYLAGPALYVPTSPQIEEGGYEVTGFQVAFDRFGKFDRDISRRVLVATQSLYEAAV